jgi:hypothetical protein
MDDTVVWQVRDLPVQTRREISLISSVYQVKTSKVIETAVHLLREYLRDPDTALPEGFEDAYIEWIGRR